MQAVGAGLEIVNEPARLDSTDIGNWSKTIPSYHRWINRLAWPIEAVGSGFVAYWAWFETPGAGWGVLVSGGIFAAFAVVSALCTAIWWGPRGVD